MKSNGTTDSNTYLTSSSSDITNLQTKTQNITGSSTLNTFTKGSIFKLSTGQNFTISDDTSPFSVTRLIVNNTGISALLPMNMNNNKITSLGTPTLDEDGVTKLYTDTADNLKLDKTGGTLSGSLTVSGNLNARIGQFDLFTVANTSGSAFRFTLSNTNATLYVTLSMNNNILNGIPTPVNNDDAANKKYVDNAPFIKRKTLTALSSVPYFTANNTLSGSTRNLFVELGTTTIQSCIDDITAGATSGAVQVSSGGSKENVICSKQNYTITGALCPSFTQTTQITGNLTIGTAGFQSTRIRVSHMKFIGNLVFDSSANQELRTYFYN